jgi:hypothetical protein
MVGHHSSGSGGPMTGKDTLIVIVILLAIAAFVGGVFMIVRN